MNKLLLTWYLHTSSVVNTVVNSFLSEAVYQKCLRARSPRSTSTNVVKMAIFPFYSLQIIFLCGSEHNLLILPSHDSFLFGLNDKNNQQNWVSNSEIRIGSTTWESRTEQKKCHFDCVHILEWRLFNKVSTHRSRRAKKAIMLLDPNIDHFNTPRVHSSILKKKS